MPERPTRCYTSNFLPSLVNPTSKTSDMPAILDQTLRPSRTSHLLVVLILLLRLKSGLGDTVQITLAGLSDAAATLLLIGLEDTDLLEGLEDLAVDGTGGIDVVRWTRTAVLGATVGLAETADTDGLADVDVAGNGGCADVEPGNQVLGIAITAGANGHILTSPGSVVGAPWRGTT